MEETPRKLLKDPDLRICTWNVRTINKEADALTKLVNVLEIYKVDIIAMQEMRLKEGRNEKQGSYYMYYRNHTNTHEFGCGFLITERLKNKVLNFKPVNERLCVMRIEAKFFNVSLICVHAPTDTNKMKIDSKDLFYKQLDDTYQSCPEDDVKIVLGDFNAKIGKEGIFGPTVGKFSYHDETSDNGRRLIDFASSRNMVISSTKFQHCMEHLQTHSSPKDEKSQKDYVLIDGRHASIIMNVRSIPRAKIGSDHFLVLAKVRTRVCLRENIRNQTPEKLDVRKLQSQEIIESYAARVSQLLLEETSTPVDNANARWMHISHSIYTAAREQLGFYRPSRNDWYDEECRNANSLKNEAYDAMKLAAEHYEELIKEEEIIKRKVLDEEETLKKANELYLEKRKEEKHRLKDFEREQERRKYQKLTNAQLTHISYSIYDEECRKANALKNEAFDALKLAKERYKDMINAEETIERKILQADEHLKIATELYQEKINEENRIFERMKRDKGRRECQELYSGNIDKLKFFKKIEDSVEDSKVIATAYKDENGNLLTDTQDEVRLWKNYCYTLWPRDDPNTIRRIELQPDLINITPPNYDEVRTAFVMLKGNNASNVYGLPVELFNAGSEVLMRYMHQLLCTIWRDESMPDDWNISILRPIHKKGNPKICSSYRITTLSHIGYKLVSLIMCERLRPYLHELIGPYQCDNGYRKSAIDQIFTLRQIMEKTQEFQADTHHLFLKFKAPFRSPIRHCLYETMLEFDIPVKLIRLCMMTLNNTRFSVETGKDRSAPFNTERGFRQDDCLSFHFFNLMMENIFRKAGVIRTRTIFNANVMLLAYGVDIDIIGRGREALSITTTAIIEKSLEMGFVMDDKKTRYFLSKKDEKLQSPKNKNVQTRYSLRSTSARSPPVENTLNEENQIMSLQFTINASTYEFKPVKNIVYLGCLINNNQNRISLEISRRLVLANRCYYWLNEHLSWKTLSRQTKKTLYQSFIKPFLLHGAETWTLLKYDEDGLKAFEKKILFNIYGPVLEDGRLYKLFADFNIIEHIKIERIRLLNHIVGLNVNEPARKIWYLNPDGKRKPGAQSTRWKDQVLTDVKRMMNQGESIEDNFPNAIRYLNETG